MRTSTSTAFFLAFLDVVCGSRIQRRHDGVKTVTATAEQTFSTTVTGGDAFSGFLSFGPSAPLAPEPTTVFVTVHTAPPPFFTTTFSSAPSHASSPPHPPSTKSPSPKPTATVGKRGLSYNDPSLLGKFDSPQITWTYNWASDPYWGNYPPNTYPQSLIYIPMLWSLDPALTSIWTANVAKAQSTYGADAVLAFNEPDGCCASCGNSCISPSAAASAYRQYIQPLRNQLELGAPAVTNGIGPNIGMDWMAQFITACSTCTIDFIPIHWYGSVLDPGSFKTYVQQFHQRFGKPIWITEFGTTTGSEAQVVAFLQQVLPWLDQQSWVIRYAYFMDRAAGVPYLLNTDDSLTGIGTYYNQ